MPIPASPSNQVWAQSPGEEMSIKPLPHTVTFSRKNAGGQRLHTSPLVQGEGLGIRKRHVLPLGVHPVVHFQFLELYSGLPPKEAIRAVRQPLVVKNERTKQINKCIKKITSGESDFETMVSNLADQLREVFSGNYHAKKRAKRDDDDDDDDDEDED